jgi:hypothetical protein
LTDAATIPLDEPEHVRPAWAPLSLVAFVALVICTNVASAVWAKWVNTNPTGLLILSSRNRYLALTLASGFAQDEGALPIRTDARVVAATLKAGESADYKLGKDRRAYLVPAIGAVEIDGIRVNARDGAAIKDVDTLRVTAIEDSELVLVDAA